MRMKEGESGFTLLVEGNTMRREGRKAGGINSLRYPGTEWIRRGDLTIMCLFPAYLPSFPKVLYPVLLSGVFYDLDFIGQRQRLT